MVMNLFCGLVPDAMKLVKDSLPALGVDEPNVRSSITIDDFTREIVKWTNIHRSHTDNSSLAPSRLQIEAANLIIDNCNGDHWGWFDPENIKLIDFWQMMDNRAQFILIFCSPQYYLKKDMSWMDSMDADLDSILEHWRNYNRQFLENVKRLEAKFEVVNLYEVLFRPDETSSILRGGTSKEGGDLQRRYEQYSNIFEHLSILYLEKINEIRLREKAPKSFEVYDELMGFQRSSVISNPAELFRCIAPGDAKSAMSKHFGSVFSDRPSGEELDQVLEKIRYLFSRSESTELGGADLDRLVKYQRLIEDDQFFDRTERL